MRTDITGHEFGRLTALSFARYDNQSRAYWLCHCRCGKEKIIRSGHLSSGRTKSCGCYRQQKTSERFQGRQDGITHGLSETKVYRTWDKVHQRCYNSNNKGFHNYGGRGITVYWRWHRDNPKGFLNFVHDMGHPPSLKHSIDRIDNDGNYEKSNCRWATAKEQNNNRRPRKAA